MSVTEQVKEDSNSEDETYCKVCGHKKRYHILSGGCIIYSCKCDVKRVK